MVSVDKKTNTYKAENADGIKKDTIKIATMKKKLENAKEGIFGVPLLDSLVYSESMQVKHITDQIMSHLVLAGKLVEPTVL